MHLSEHQLRFFRTFGYLALPGLFRDEIDALNQAFREVWTANAGGLDGSADDLNERLTIVVPFVDQHPYLSALIDDPRVHDIGVSICGEDFNYMTSDGNVYSGDTPWHSDCSHGAKLSIKLAFYLDRLDVASGSLRVIPGSHLKGGRFSQMLNAVDYYRAPADARTGLPEKAWGVPGQDVPAVALETEPGDILIFHHELKHASFGGGTRRRMFTMNMQKRQPEDDLEPRSQVGRQPVAAPDGTGLRRRDAPNRLARAHAAPRAAPRQRWPPRRAHRQGASRARIGRREPVRPPLPSLGEGWGLPRTTIRG